MSRISALRSTTLQPISRSRLRCCAGESGSSKIRDAHVRELEPVTYWFQRNGQRIRKTVRWYRMRPLQKVGEHDHEVDEVLWTDAADARARLRYESDLKLIASV